jgi:hypothetical protein
MLPLRPCVAVALALLGREAEAQTCNSNGCSVPVTGTLSVNATANMSLSSANTTLDAPRAADFAAGFRNTPGPTVTVRANTGVRVVVSTTAAAWTLTGGTRPTPKAVDDLRWGTSAAGPYAALTRSASTADLLSTSATASSPRQIFYQVRWSWTQDVPGTYTLPVAFTLVAP